MNYKRALLCSRTVNRRASKMSQLKKKKRALPYIFSLLLARLGNTAHKRPTQNTRGTTLCPSGGSLEFSDWKQTHKTIATPVHSELARVVHNLLVHYWICNVGGRYQKNLLVGAAWCLGMQQLARTRFKLYWKVKSNILHYAENACWA